LRNLLRKHQLVALMAPTISAFSGLSGVYPPVTNSYDFLSLYLSRTPAALDDLNRIGTHW
jgi:hypothetical protein